MDLTNSRTNIPRLRVLPGGKARQILWSLANSCDFQVLAETSWRPSSEPASQRLQVAAAGAAAANLLWAAEPVIRYQRERFRGGRAIAPGSPRYELGLQTKEAPVHRLVEICAAGEAGAALAFETLRLLDSLRGDETTNVLVPACSLWSVTYGARAMREAVSLMGAKGPTADCPGRLGDKWIESLLKVSGPRREQVQVRLGIAMTEDLFLGVFGRWIRECWGIAESYGDMGADALAAAMQLWRWTLRHLGPHGSTFALAEALCALLASRSQILAVLKLQEKGPSDPTLAEELPGLIGFLTDLCRVQVGCAAGEVARVCTELVYGRRHPLMGDSQAWLEEFHGIRSRLDDSQAGCLIAKDRAALSLTGVAIP